MKTADSKSYIFHRDELLLLASEYDLNVDTIAHYENYKQLETLIITNKAFKESTEGLIHISGTHGIEGLAGAGTQISILQNHGAEISSSKLGVMFVFALNPFGFHFRRRTGIENIDLNRNCGDGFAPPQKKLAHFFVNPLINANSKLKYYLSWPLAILGIPIAGYSQVMRAIAEGQDCYPNGLFYTGKKIALEIKNLLTEIGPQIANKKDLFILDFHTGLGIAGEEQLFDVSPQKPFPTLEDIFNTKVTIPGATKESYRGSGLLADRLAQLYPNIHWTYVVQEMGVRSNFESFLNLARENVFHSENFNSLDEKTYLNHPTKMEFLFTYFPQMIESQHQMFEKGRTRFLEAFKRKRA